MLNLQNQIVADKIKINKKKHSNSRIPYYQHNIPNSLYTIIFFRTGVHFRLNNRTTVRLLRNSTV